MFLLLFTVLLIKGILDLAWHLATRMKFGTCEQNWDLYGTISGLWSQLGPSPKFGTSLRALFLLFGFFLFRDQIFRNRDRDFFRDKICSKPILFFRNQIFRNRNRDFFRYHVFRNWNRDFFPKPNFPKPKPKPQRFGKSFETEKFWNRNVNLWCEVMIKSMHAAEN